MRKALSDLATDGTLIREHGRGTFVSYSNPTTEDLWQLRFLETPTGEPLPVTFKLRDKKSVSNQGPWLRSLDERGRDLRIHKATCGQWPLCLRQQVLCLDDKISRNSKKKIPKRELNLNFKQLLSERFAVYTHSV